MASSLDRPLQRTRLASADLRAAWEEHAAEFIAWARKPDFDSYWRFIAISSSTSCRRRAPSRGLEVDGGSAFRSSSTSAP
jgi:hypothetical protein